MRKALFVLMMVMMATALFGRGTPESVPMEMPSEEQTIVDLAVADGRFSTLVTALEAAGLLETLSGDGPFTVFAPTDEAFDALPAGTVEGLLADPAALANVLTYHVVSGSVMASDVVNLTSATTLQGEPLVVSVADGVAINQANVLQTDVVGSNGVIHVIDSVLLPPSQDIVDIAVEAGTFTTLVAALEAAGLVDTLRGEGAFTVFAPTDEAFAQLPSGTLEALLNDIPTLTSILTYHVVPGQVFSGDVVNVTEAPTLQGQAIDVAVTNGMVVLDGESTVVATDLLATNGVVHVIDRVILPN